MSPPSSGDFEPENLRERIDELERQVAAQRRTEQRLQARDAATSVLLTSLSFGEAAPRLLQGIGEALGGQQGAPIPVNVVAAAPAIFTLNQQGTGAGAILHGTTYQVVTATNPATAGEIISIYCTGLGAVNPAAQTGAIPPDPPPQTVLPVQVSIAGVTKSPLYAGVAPGFAGLYQVNAQIPPGTPSGAQPL